MYYTDRAHPNGPSLSVIVPTYNERARLPELLDGILAGLAAHGVAGEIVVVDDNSPDRTWEIAEEYARRAPVKVIRRAGKLGLGTAVMAGFAAAAAPVFGVIDADLSHPPDMLPRMLAALKESGADVVVGSRYIPGGSTRNWPMVRWLMSRLACALARPITPVRDATSGFFLIAREAVRDVQIVSGGFKICLELIVRSSPRTIAEVPYVFTNRITGESKMNWREASGYLKQLVMLWRYQRAQRRPRPTYSRPVLPPPSPEPAPRISSGVE